MADERVHVITLRLRQPSSAGGNGGRPGVEGSVELDDGTARPFSGWIELLDHLESVFDADPTAQEGMTWQ